MRQNSTFLWGLVINSSIFLHGVDLYSPSKRERDCKGMNIKISRLCPITQPPYKDVSLSQFGGHVLAYGHVNTCLLSAVPRHQRECARKLATGKRQVREKRRRSERNAGGEMCGGLGVRESEGERERYRCADCGGDEMAPTSPREREREVGVREGTCMRGLNSPPPPPRLASVWRPHPIDSQARKAVDSARLSLHNRVLHCARVLHLPRCEELELELECIARDRAWVRALDARVRARARCGSHCTDDLGKRANLSSSSSISLLDYKIVRSYIFSTNCPSRKLMRKVYNLFFNLNRKEMNQGYIYDTIRIFKRHSNDLGIF